MVIEELRTNSVVKALVEPVIALAAELERGPVRAEVVLQVAVQALAIVSAAARARVIVPVAAAPELGTVPVAAALELGTGPVAAVPELETVPVAAVPELEIVPAAAVPELEIVPVAAGLGLVQAVAELERGQVPAVAGRLRTRSVIAARRPGQVLLLTVEDLAVAVAETTREPAAAEAGKAWEAAE
jgi:hypothetical protein